MPNEQNYANHKRYVFGYHGVAFAGIVINLGWSVRQLIREVNGDRIVALLLAVGLVFLFFYTRLFALGAQDRVIRLEEQLRLARVLPEDLRGRIGELRRGQILALRFASDAEVPELTRRVLAGELAKADAIKRAIRDWRADHHRI